MNTNKMAGIFGLPLFSLMLFAPTVWQIGKIFLLIPLVLLIMSRIFQEQTIFLSRKVVMTLFIAMCAAMFGLIVGVFFNTPGAFKVQTVMMLWPVLFCLLITQIRTTTHLEVLVKTILVATLFIDLFTILFLFNAFNVSSVLSTQIMRLSAELNAASVNYAGYIKYSLVSVSTLVYVFPFLILTCFTKTFKQYSFSRKLIFLLLILLTVVCVLSTGRRALLLVIPAVFGYAILVEGVFLRSGMGLSLIKNSIKYLFWLAIAYIIFSWLFHVDISSFYRYIMNSFNFENNSSNVIRKEEFYGLLYAWGHHPFFGAGAGAALSSIVRDPSQPWAYELYYIALLFQYGIIGVFIYAGLIYWLFFQSFQIMRYTTNQSFRDITFAATGAFFFFLCANATNPYLGKFDLLWTLFFQVALVNLWLLKKIK